MKTVSRREFLQQAGVGVAAAGVMVAGARRAAAEPLGIPIGAQTYPSRQMVADGQFPQLCQKLYAAGVRQIELCSPGYTQFKSLADGKATKKIIDDSGLRVISSHFTMNELRHKLPESLQWAHDLGLSQMGTASLGGRTVDGRTTLEIVQRATAEFNQIGDTVHRGGLQLFLHNEGFEDTHLDDGRLTYPVLLEYLDPILVKMQFQMSGMLMVGDPVMYFTTYPGRFISAHLHGVDFAAAPAPLGLPLPVKRAPGRGRGRGNTNEPPPVAMGDDSVDWPRVFEAAKVGGMKNYFIEQEQPNGGWDAMEKDVAYLKTLS